VLPPGELTCIKLAIVRAVHKKLHIILKVSDHLFCPFVA